MNGSTVDKINDRLPDGKSIEKSHLSRMISGERPCRDETIRKAIIDVLGREAGACYDWQTACEMAEKNNDVLREKITKLNHNRIFAFHRLTPRIVCMWITFLLIFLSLIYGRPALDNLAITRMENLIGWIYEVEAENALLRTQLDAMGPTIETLSEYVEDLETKIDIIDGGER